MKTITLQNNTHWKNNYSVIVENNGRKHEERFSHASKARKYVKDFFESNEITVVDKIVEPIKKIKIGRWQ